MEPQFTLLKPEDYVKTTWAGGVTTQLAISPAGADYGARDFLWRVSSATVSLDESDFTSLPDYRRFISTLQGDMTLSHNGGAQLALHPGDVHPFDGGDNTHSLGRCTDFNLMLRKGRADGDMRSLRLSAGSVGSFSPDPRAESVLLFCAEGSAEVSCGDRTVSLRAWESLLIENAADAALSLRGAEDALLMVAQAWHSK